MKRFALLLAVGLLATGCAKETKLETAPVPDDTPSTTTTPPSDSDSEGEADVAMWPSSDVTHATPEAAARDFVAKVLDVPPALGEFRAGDSRSGEIDVLSRGEGGSSSITRATLVLRQFGPRNGWFIVSAGSEGVSITNLSTGDKVDARAITVQGQARGFEGSVVVSAYVRGDDVELAKKAIQAGSMGERKAYTATLDLAAPAGSTLFVVVRGGTGLETDPGEFAAIPLTT